MTRKQTFRLLYFWLVLVMVSCSTDERDYILIEPEPVSPVNFVISELPYQNLSEYNFYEGNLANLEPVYGVIPMALNSTLFTDYAKKKRFIWMPKNVKANYINDYSVLDFPVGAILIKNFYYDNVLPENKTVILETRLMIKLEDEWIFANYLWNDDQTEAVFSTSGSTVHIDWIDNGVNKSVDYNIPSLPKCATCHNDFNGALPIGPKPQNLNLIYPYSDGYKNQLRKWVEQGYLNDNYPSTIVSTVDWENTMEPLDQRVRSYFDINCAHCHSDEGYCDYAKIRLSYKDTTDPYNLGVCVENDFPLEESEFITHIISPGDPDASALFHRINTLAEENRMPLLGRTLAHEEALTLIEYWINSLTTNCN